MVVLFISFFLLFEWAFRMDFLIVSSILVIVANGLMLHFWHRDMNWKHAFIHCVLFLVIVVFWGAFRIATGDSRSGSNDSNQAIGLLLIVLFLVYFISMVLGNLLGMVLRICYKK